MCNNIITWWKNILGIPFGFYTKMPRPWRKIPIEAQLANAWHSVGKDFYAVLKRIEGDKNGKQTKRQPKQP